LLSVELLASDFIAEVEREFLLDKVNAKSIAPVMLCNFSLDDYEDALGELLKTQIHRYQYKNHKVYAWNECRTDPIKNSYADELSRKLVNLLDAEFDRERDSLEEKNERHEHSADHEKSLFADKAADFHAELDPRHVKKSRAHFASLQDVSGVGVGVGVGDGPVGSEVVAADHLLEWAESIPSVKTEFYAVLGEFGIGKTTALHQFAQALLEARKADPNLPLPLLFDLRNYTPTSVITLVSLH
jgi:predicted NACHT family NTPase